MIELFNLSGQWRRYQACDLAAMFGSSMSGMIGGYPMPCEIDTVAELQQMLCPQRVVGDDEPDEAIELEQVLDALANDGYWLAPDKTVFLIDRSYRGGPDDGGESACSKAAA